MNPNELKGQATREWLSKAAGDLSAARLLAGAGNEDNALYHCQQCAENGLKAFLTWHDQPFRRTHDLEEIGLACAAIDTSLDPVAQAADSLTDFAWRSRYPGNPYVLAEGEMAAMLALAGRILAEVRSRLPAETRLESNDEGHE